MRECTRALGHRIQTPHTARWQEMEHAHKWMFGVDIVPIVLYHVRALGQQDIGTIETACHAPTLDLRSQSQAHSSSWPPRPCRPAGKIGRFAGLASVPSARCSIQPRSDRPSPSRCCGPTNRERRRNTGRGCGANVGDLRGRRCDGLQVAYSYRRHARMRRPNQSLSSCSGYRRDALLLPGGGMRLMSRLTTPQ